MKTSVTYSTDQRAIIEQIKKATVSTVAGDGTAGFLDGPAQVAKFRSPLDVAVMPDGTIYVADAFNSRIRMIQDGLVTTLAGNGMVGVTNGRGSDARFKIPGRITFDAAGNLYVLDAADPRVRKINPEADVSTYAGTDLFGFRDGEAATAQFGQSFGIVADTQGNIYVADSQNDRICKISVAGKVNTMVGNGIPGFVNGNSDPVQFRSIRGIAIDKQGNLFVADVSRIRKITPLGIVSTFAGSHIIGHADGAREIAHFFQLEDVVIDHLDNIFVTDKNRIRKITPSGMVSTVAGSVAGYEDGDGSTAKFDGPQGLASDQHGNVYVADFNNKRIRKISFE